MENKKRIKLSISAFRAIDNPSGCEEFIEGHTNVLRHIGISVNKLTSANIAWSKSAQSNVIIARSIEDGQLIGGARVDIAGEGHILPIEQAVGPLDERIYLIVKESILNGGTGEVCGVWTSRKVAGMGVALLLLRAAISLTTQLELNSLFVFCSEATFSMFIKMGCIVYTALGNNGTFYYPKEDLVATALILPDPDFLKHAHEINKENIFNLRTHPQQKKIEIGPKGELEIDYDLVIFKGTSKI